MFRRIRNYPIMATSGRSFRPRAYGSQQLDGSWGGWLVFFPPGGGSAIASDRETTQLEEAEYDALEEAERLESAAEVERAAAEVDTTAAAQARIDAEQIRRDRIATEGALAETEATLAAAAAEVHAEAAREARAVAADAARRSRDATDATTDTTRPKARGAKKK
jgi:hypothetical protein